MSASNPQGVIVPPGQIKEIADKTAKMVTNHGPSFESMLLEAEGNNPKFNFLKPGDIYRPYYDKLLGDLADAALSSIQPEKASEVLFEQPAQVQPTQPKRPVRQPPPDQYSVRHPYAAIVDRETIKLTAQYVARNGQKFLTGLSERESKNPQFDFLKPTHLLFGYFTSLVDAYSRCLMPRKDELIKLQRYVADPSLILEQGMDRHEYEKVKMQDEKKVRDEKVKEEEQEAMQIDWYDFVTVETITFDDKSASAPAAPGAVQISGTDNIKREGAADMDMEMDLDTEEGKALASVAKKVEAQRVAAGEAREVDEVRRMKEQALRQNQEEEEKRMRQPVSTKLEEFPPRHRRSSRDISA